MVFSIGSLAQDNGRFINGILLDAESSEPVVFATIRVTGKALGVISNNDGSFQIPTEFQFKGEQLEISSMGYQTKIIAFTDLKKGIVNRIYVKSAGFELAETVVTGRKKRGPTAKQIIRYALRRIPENYQNNPFGLIGYYRDYQFKEKTYINLNEALVQVWDQGFAVDDYRSIRFGLFDYKTNLNFKIDSFAAKPYDYSQWDKYIPNATLGGTYAPNEMVLLFIHDAVRNHGIDAYSYVYTMVEDFVREHRFSRVKHTFYGAQKVYQIDFSKIDVPFQVQGTIYVDVDSFAIRKLDYAVHKQKFDDSSPSKYSTTEKDLLYGILVEYQEYKNRMYLNYISFHNQFKLIRPAKFFIKDVLLVAANREMKVFLNTPAANWPNDFSVKYQGKSLKIDGILKVDPSTFIIKFKEKKLPKQQELLQLLFSTKEDEKKRSLEIEIPQLIDGEGNRLGYRESEIMDQFREFFTQKVIDDNDGHHLQDSLLVKKTFSLGHPLQPQMEQVLDDDFWMNTPLKSKP
ncbi:MAG: carboxypeptidase-like regulatory domain-containing protein [Bacteroidota bacterium]